MGWTNRCSNPGMSKEFASSHKVHVGSGPIQSPIQRVPRALFPELNRPERKVEHSSQSSVNFKNEWNFISISFICLHGLHRATLAL